MPKDTRSFFERLTGSVDVETEQKSEQRPEESAQRGEWLKTDDTGQLMVDVFQTPDAVIIQSVVAGVKPEDLDVAITQDMVTITGARKNSFQERGDNYYYQELYWGKFARSILVPQEIDDERAEAKLKNGVLTIHLPKIDKNRTQKLKIKNE